MVEKHLPGGADIHGGGTDLRFPHHENELAQSCAAHPDRTFVRAWAHHGMVTLGESGKMAKSVGNVLDIEEAVKKHGRNALRMWLLQSHYSQPIEYSEEILEEKRRSYERLLRLWRRISGSDGSSELSDELAAELRERADRAMGDDLATQEAIAALFEVAGRAGQEIARRPEAAGEFRSLVEAMEDLLSTFGFDLSEEGVAEVGGVRVGYGDEEPDEEALRRAAEREEARRKKDWETADRLRAELADWGWTVEDTPEGPVLNRR
jgi:cysteinyl-tRNA synthetase